jgi:hypothetical protein
MGGIMETLFGTKSKPTQIGQMLPSLTKNVSTVGFGADRGQLNQGLGNTYNLNTDLYSNSAQGLNAQIANMGNQLGGVAEGVSGYATQLANTANYNPYLDYYNNPAATYQRDQAARQAAIEAAYGNYGSLGAQFQGQSGLLNASAAQRGITNSGVARRQQEQLAERKQAAELEARNKAITDSNGYLLNVAGLYNQGQQLRQTGLGQAGQMKAATADMYTKAPQLQMQATNMYGDEALKAGQLWGQNQSEWRNAQQASENYNTQLYNQTQANWANAMNNRTMQQANIDSNFKKPGILSDFIMPAVGLGASLFGGRG